MASLYRPNTATYRLADGSYRTADGKRVTKQTPGAVKVKGKRSSVWYGKYADAAGVVRRVKLCSDKTASKQMLAKLVTQSALAEHGIADPARQEHAKRPLAEHLADFEADLRAKGCSAKQVGLKIGRVRRVLDSCSFIFMVDLSASRVQQHLADLQAARRDLLPLDPGKEWFTVNELAAILGVKTHSIRPLVRRHRLQADGNGKGRRFPRCTVLALQGRWQAPGVQTANYYLREIKAFCHWLVKDRRMTDNPLAHLSGGNAKQDRRHDRLPLTPDELRAVIAAAAASGITFRELTGQDRAVLYATAAGTGFRASELASLTPNAFDLDCTPSTVMLAAVDAKNGRQAVQPLSPELAAMLAACLAGKPDGLPVWPGTWFKKAADMFRLDLEAAGIPYASEGAEGTRYRDFHSLRHTFISLLDKSGATLKEAMQLARHSDPKLTMAVYGRAQLHDLGQAVKRLPSMLSGPNVTRGALRATGTDGAPGPRLDQTCEKTCVSVTGHETAAHPMTGGCRHQEMPELIGFESDCEQLTLTEEISGGGDRTRDTRLMKPLL